LAVDQERRCILIDGIAPINGVTDFRLISVLAKLYTEDIQKGLSSRNFRTPATKDLADEVSANEVLLRKVISRIRKAVCQEFKQLYGDELGPDDIIENVQRKGYRLNPNKVCVVAPSQIRGP